VIGVFLFVIALLAVVLIHEAGHFTAAKAYGIKVEEYFVGFGPLIWSTKRGLFGSGRWRKRNARSETDYGVKALPLGGYVRIAGMNPYEEVRPEDLPRTYGAKPIHQRAVVILAGPITHFAVAFVILFFYLLLIGVPNPDRPVIADVQAQLNGQTSPAAAAGLRPGDEIVEVAGTPVGSTDDFIAYTRSHTGEPITITVVRDGERVSVQATPVLSQVPGETKPVGRLGVNLDEAKQRYGPIAAIGKAGQLTGQVSVAVVTRLGDVFGPAGIKRIGQLLTGAPRQVTDPTSIVGGAQIAGAAVRSGNWAAFLELLVTFNIFVGILNLVPLPPFDGGHLAVLGVEKITHKSVDMRKLVPLTAVVAGFMILLVLSLTFIDITNPLPNPFR
jgi:membrane-associated protease RseP (regulator of RpoE activity)